jgi:hypothetical protein
MEPFTKENLPQIPNQITSVYKGCITISSLYLPSTAAHRQTRCWPNIAQSRFLQIQQPAALHNKHQLATTSHKRNRPLRVSHLYTLFCPVHTELLHAVADNEKIKNHGNMDKDTLSRMLAAHFALKTAVLVRVCAGRHNSLSPETQTNLFVQYTNKKMPEIIDPISGTVMLNPVVVSSGICYDYDSLRHWLIDANKLICPQTGVCIESKAYPNHSIILLARRKFESLGVLLDTEPRLPNTQSLFDLSHLLPTNHRPPSPISQDRPQRHARPLACVSPHDPSEAPSFPRQPPYNSIHPPRPIEPVCILPSYQAPYAQATVSVSPELDENEPQRPVPLK